MGSFEFKCRYEIDTQMKKRSKDTANTQLYIIWYYILHES